MTTPVSTDFKGGDSSTFAVTYLGSDQVKQEETVKKLIIFASLVLGVVIGWIAVGKFVGYRKQ